MPRHPEDKNEMGIGIWYALLAGVSGALGNAVESISIITLLHPFFTLKAVHHLELAWQRWKYVGTWAPTLAMAIMNVVLGSAYALAFLDVPAYPAPSADSHKEAAAWGYILASNLVPLVYLSTLRVVHVFPPAHVNLFVFPVLHTAFWSLCGFFPKYAWANPAYALLDYAPLAQLASVASTAGINFLTGLLSGALFLLTLRPTGAVSLAAAAASVHPSARVHRVPPAALAVVAGALAVGGALLNAGHFFQRPVRDVGQRYARVGCATGIDVEFRSKAYDALMADTHRLLHDSDAGLVLWSETAVKLTDGAQEDRLLADAADLLSRSGVRAAGKHRDADKYLGVTYSADFGAKGAYRNMFVLLSDAGEVWRYNKAHPVPLIEDDYAPGPPVIPTADTPLGRLGGVICFDVDFASYIWQAGRAGVAMLLQPSQTWGSVGARHFAANGLRAVENGLTLVRCSSDGVSGVVDRHYRYTSWREATRGDAMVFEVPLAPHARTVWTWWGGWLLPWANVGAAAVLWVVVLLGGRGVARWRCAGLWEVVLWPAHRDMGRRLTGARDSVVSTARPSEVAEQGAGAPLLADEHGSEL
ncbi:unnamed protein product [Pedinophyceae sp. YPF-701]|nr:unnamed protein product [Pedinophyceae sp. YPF-701]